MAPAKKPASVKPSGLFPADTSDGHGHRHPNGRQLCWGPRTNRRPKTDSCRRPKNEGSSNDSSDSSDGSLGWNTGNSCQA
jgi:hypothetical protein